METKTDVFDLLKSRGYIFQTSNEEGIKNALKKPVVLYQGFDPSGDSLHLGHLLGLMGLHYFQEAGHKVIFLIGGGTGKVGDPSGKSSTRVMLDSAIVNKNAHSLSAQVEKIGLLRFSGENAALLVNNDSWLSKFTFIDDFMMDIAKYFSVNDLVKMRTFEDRLKNDAPLSLLEFCYPALQAWDYLELHDTYNCTVQVGGQDQWTNILAGVELIRKKLQKEVYAATFPLLTTSDGVKMGKTEKGPVWLDAAKTSPYDFYQYLIKTPDDTVPNLLRLFTFLSLEEINEIVKNPKVAQQRLAYEVTKLVHGKDEADKATRSESIPVLAIDLGTGIPLIEALVKSGCISSNAEARRRIIQNAVTFGGEKISDTSYVVNKSGLIKFGKGGLLKIVAE